MSKGDKKLPPITGGIHEAPGGVQQPATGAGAGAGEGIKSLQTSNVFRNLNFELYAKPNKFIMITGALAVSGCVGYLAWLKYTWKKNNLYTALDENEELVLREKKSRWS